MPMGSTAERLLTVHNKDQIPGFITPIGSSCPVTSLGGS